MGFTIIELLMAMVFFSFILMFAAASYVRINRAYVRGANVKLVQQETRKVLNEISEAVREAGSSSVVVIDNDASGECPPGGNVNTESYDGTPTEQQLKCVHRVCIGDKKFAWNQGYYVENENPTNEHTWFYYKTQPGDVTRDNQPLPEGQDYYLPFNVYDDGKTNPFSVVRENSKSAGNCAGKIIYQDSTDLVDSSRIIVQDIDVVSLDRSNNSFKITVSLSTLDINPNDQQDLKYEDDADRERKATSCYTDQGSQQFCYVHTLSTIVSIR
jgi:type II secretory pathway pseudopilin PulG